MDRWVIIYSITFAGQMKQTATKNKERLNIILAFVAIYFIWGSTYLFNKILVKDFPPFLIAGIRFLIASVLIFAIAWVMKIPFDTTKTRVKNAAFAGILMLTIGNGAAVWALQYVDSGITAMLVSSQPLFLLLIIYFLDGKRVPPQSILGIALGIAGIYLLVSDTELATSSQFYIGVAMVFIAVLTWAYGSYFVAKAELPRNPFINSGVQMLFAGISLLMISGILGEEWNSLSRLNGPAIASWAYLIVFGSVIAFTAFNYLLKKVSAEKVSTNTYVNPVVALFLGWLWLSEPITLRALLASALLLMGVYFINIRKEKRQINADE